MMGRTIRGVLTSLLLALTGCPESCSAGAPVVPTENNTPYVGFPRDAIVISRPGTKIINLSHSNDLFVDLTGSQPSGLTTTPKSYKAVGDSSQFVLNVAAEASLGAQDLVILGKNGPTVKQFFMNVTVVDPFTIETTPNLIARAGQPITGTVRIGRARDFAGPITLGFFGLPDGSTVQFDAVPATEASTVGFTILTPATATVSAYGLLLTAVGNGVTLRAPVSLNLGPPVVGSELELKLDKFEVKIAPLRSFSTVAIVLARAGPSLGDATLSVSAPPPGVTLTLNKSLLAGTDTTAQLEIATNNAPVGGPFLITITATTATVTRSVTFMLTINPSVSLTAEPFFVTMAGVVTQPQLVNVGVMRNGPAGDVAIDLVYSARGITATVTPAIVRDDRGAVISLTSDGTTPPGTYSIAVRATFAYDVVGTFFNVVVPGPPPNGDVTPAFAFPSYNVAQGALTSLQLNLLRSGVLVNAPLSLIATTIPPSSTATPSTPSTIGDVTFVTLKIGDTTPIGPHPLTVTVVNGTLTRTATTTINVTAPAAPTFTLSPAIEPWTLPRDAFTPFNIVINPFGGFASPVTFTAVSPMPGQILVEFQTNPATGFVRVNVYASRNVTPAPYTIAFTATSGSIVRTLNVQILVQ